MKTILATGLHRVDEYILKTHADILILDRVDNIEGCLAALRMYKPDLLVFSDQVVYIEEQAHFITEVVLLVPGMNIIYLNASSGSVCREDLEKRGISCLYSPVSGQDISRLLYEIKRVESQRQKVVAVWSPKSGDGASLTCEAMTQLLWQCRDNNQDSIGMLDFNVKSPWLKYRLELDEKVIIDELLPYISAGSLTPEVLRKYSREIRKKTGLCFVGGIGRPELYNRYNSTQFNTILNIAGALFRQIVIDAGSLLDNAGTVTALKNADLIFAVLQPDYVSRQCLKQSMGLFPAYGIDPNKVKILINWHHPQLSEEPAAVIKGLNLEMAGSLPDIGISVYRSGGTLLFDNQHDRAVLAYMSTLRDVLQKYGLVTDTSKKKTGLMPRIFARGAQR